MSNMFKALSAFQVACKECSVLQRLLGAISTSAAVFCLDCSALAEQTRQEVTYLTVHPGSTSS